MIDRINNIINQPVMVCGDFIADIYEYGTIRRMSREAPIPIVEFEREKLVPGGAGNVVNNIMALQGKAFPLSVVGKDESGTMLLAFLQKSRIQTEGILCVDGLFTTTKRRILAQGEHTVRQQVLRLDRLPRKPLGERELAELWDQSSNFLKQVEAVIISDYHLPVIPLRFLMDLSLSSQKAGKKVIIDSRHRVKEFQGVTLSTPNLAEAEEAVARKISNHTELEEAGKRLLGETGAELILITLGDQGMALFCPHSGMQLMPAHNRLEVFDVSGAGDTVVAAITLGLLAGMEPLEAAKFANIAAGLVVRKLGTATVSLTEIKEHLGLGI